MGLRSDTARFTVVFEQPAYKAQTDTKGDGQLPHSPFAVFISLDKPYERWWFIRPEWEWPREERYRGVLIDSADNDPDRGSLASGHELTYQSYLRGEAQEGNQLIVWNSERQLVGPQYRWIAMNSNVARELGWTLCPTNPFEWLDSAGHSLVKSVYWKDGWIWLEPPRFEALGEGWYVLASDLAVETLRRAFPDAQTHLWVERHSHGDKPYEGSWHLRQPF
jgi:hypothetical protein